MNFRFQKETFSGSHLTQADSMHFLQPLPVAAVAIVKAFFASFDFKNVSNDPAEGTRIGPDGGGSEVAFVLSRGNEVPQRDIGLLLWQLWIWLVARQEGLPAIGTEVKVALFSARGGFGLVGCTQEMATRRPANWKRAK